jgi:nitrate/TMAO reductase-like tetraheme cytochrome c subunit
MKANIPPGKKKLMLIPILAALLVLGVMAAVGGLSYAAIQESRDIFCSSCHTQPESTYFARSTAAQPADLASFHTGQKTRCIDCHSGQGLPGRLSAELLGAKNAFKWYTGTAVQPAVLTIPIDNPNCLKCHAAVTQQNYSPKAQLTAPGGRGGEGERGRNNHWHTFLSRWQSTPGVPANAGTCSSCHSGHLTDVNVNNGFMNDQNVRAGCDDCHAVLRREGGGD